MSKNDTFGSRMKEYEGLEAQRRLMPRLPIIARLDGKCFSKFTKGLQRPYDIRMSRLMVELSKLLVIEYNALISYTQSDEISLVLYTDDPNSQTPYGGRIQKLVGDMTAFATLHFNKMLPTFIPEKADQLPRFDCRVWNVPTLTEAANAILWRVNDATKNSISMAAHDNFSHKPLHGMNGKQMQDRLMLEKGINWNDYPAFFKRGTFVRRETVSRKYTCDEIEKLPAKHQARTNPDLVIERHMVMEIEMPPFNKVTNRVEVVFENANPILGE